MIQDSPPDSARPNSPASVDAFEAARPRLRAVAYRMLGSWTDAEDVVQDAYLRWQGARATVDAPEAWLVRVVTNLCLDARKSSRAKRETYVGPWLPEPVATLGGCLAGEPIDPDEISLAFLTMLERLSPLERAVYVLSQAFDFEPAEIAAILERSEAAVRQLLHRAREHVREGRPRFSATADAHVRMVGAFATACATGDLDGLKSLLASDAAAVTDGGGRHRAALKIVEGADRVARLFIGISKKGPEGLTFEIREVNGAPTGVALVDGKPYLVVQLDTDGERIFGVLLVINPEKLAHVQIDRGDVTRDGPSSSF